MTYKIKPEFVNLWGEDATEDTILTEADLEMIARGWEKPVEELLDQLIPQEENTMDSTLYTALIETNEGIHLIHKAISDPNAEYEDFEIAMENKADELGGELHCIYADEDIVEDITL